MEIVSFICNQRKVSPDDVMSDARHGRVPYTRFMIWFYLHYTAGWSANRIAKEFGRTRTSIFRGMRVLKYQMKHSKSIRNEYQAILEKLEGASSDTPSVSDMEEN